MPHAIIADGAKLVSGFGEKTGAAAILFPTCRSQFSEAGEGSFGSGSATHIGAMGG